MKWIQEKRKFAEALGNVLSTASGLESDLRAGALSPALITGAVADMRNQLHRLDDYAKVLRGPVVRDEDPAPRPVFPVTSPMDAETVRSIFEGLTLDQLKERARLNEVRGISVSRGLRAEIARREAVTVQPAPDRRRADDYAERSMSPLQAENRRRAARTRETGGRE